MKSFLFVLLLLVNRVGVCQKNDGWGIAPEKIIAIHKARDSHLVKQETDETKLYLSFQQKGNEGIISNFIFESERLICIMVQYDTKIIVPTTPNGEKKQLSSGKFIWVDYGQNTITTREYEDRFINDMMIPVPKPK